VRCHYREISLLGSLARHAVAILSAGCGYFPVHVWLCERNLQVFPRHVFRVGQQGLLGELNSGRVDFVVSGMSPTEERKKTVDFSIPYYYCQTAVLQTKDAGVYDVATMKGKPIAAAFGTEYHKFAAAAGADIHALDTDAICLQELLAGRVVGLMLDAASASARQKKYPDAQLVFHVIPQKDLDAMRSAAVSDCFACVFPKGSELEALFSGALKELMAEGFMRKNYEKWIGPMPESSKNPY